MRVVVELIAARVVGENVHFVMGASDCPRNTDPEPVARAELARLFPELWLRRVILHSTSWRFEDEHIVLSYLAYSDDFVAVDLPLMFPLERVEDLNDAPSAFVAHAIRHLAFLTREDPAKYEKRVRPEVMVALRKVAPELAGRHSLKGAA